MKSAVLAASAAVFLVLVSGDFVSASEPGWSPVVIARGEYREQIKSLPMEQRPYRPLHFYGNTVRRIHYRGVPVPAPRDVLAPVYVSGARLIGR